MATRPPLFSQLAVPDSQARSDCGETTTAMLLWAGGVHDTPIEEISDLGHDGTTYAPELSKLLTDAGALLTPLQPSQIASVLADGRTYALILIKDNNNGDPDPNGPFTHWIGGYDATAIVVRCVNPWPQWGNASLPARDIAYDARTLADSTIWATAIRWPVIAPTPAPRSPLSYEDEAMNGPMWDATTAPWQPNQNIAWIDKAGTLHQRWSPETGGAGKSAVLATGMTPSGTIDLFVDGPRKTIHLRARTAGGDLWHAWEVASGPWGSELVA